MSAPLKPLQLLILPLVLLILPPMFPIPATAVFRLRRTRFTDPREMSGPSLCSAPCALAPQWLSPCRPDSILSTPALFRHSGPVPLLRLRCCRRAHCSNSPLRRCRLRGPSFRYLLSRPVLCFRFLRRRISGFPAVSELCRCLRRLDRCSRCRHGFPLLHSSGLSFSHFTFCTFSVYKVHPFNIHKSHISVLISSYSL